jgi:hypothetical protein
MMCRSERNTGLRPEQQRREGDADVAADRLGHGQHRAEFGQSNVVLLQPAGIADEGIGSRVNNRMALRRFALS